GVRVDAPRAGARDRRRGVEREPRGVGEQVAQRGAGRPGRLVDVDDALLGRDERRERRDELRDRGPADGAGAVADGAQLAPVRVEHRDRRERRRPRFDLTQSLHSLDTRAMERRSVPAVSPFADLMGYGRVVRIDRHVWVAGTAPVMPDGADPPADAYGQAKRCLEIALAAM